MHKFQLVTQTCNDIPYMRQPQAAALQELIREEGARNILEIGFYHGKSSVYIGAILEDQGAGHLLTLDMKSARNRTPNIETLLPHLGYDHYREYKALGWGAARKRPARAPLLRFPSLSSKMRGRR